MNSICTFYHSQWTEYLKWKISNPIILYIIIVLPSGVSKATPTQLPLANSVLPINITVPDFWPPWDDRTITGSPTCTHEGMGSSISLFKSARLPNEQILISSPSVRSSNTNKDDIIKTPTYIHVTNICIQ